MSPDEISGTKLLPLIVPIAAQPLFAALRIRSAFGVTEVSSQRLNATTPPDKVDGSVAPLQRLARLACAALTSCTNVRPESVPVVGSISEP